MTIFSAHIFLVPGAHCFTVQHATRLAGPPSHVEAEGMLLRSLCLTLQLRHNRPKAAQQWGEGRLKIFCKLKFALQVKQMNSYSRPLKFIMLFRQTKFIVRALCWFYRMIVNLNIWRTTYYLLLIYCSYQAKTTKNWLKKKYIYI